MNNNFFINKLRDNILITSIIFFTSSLSFACMGGRAIIPLDDTYFINQIDLQSDIISLTQKDGSSIKFDYDKEKDIWLLNEVTADGTIVKCEISKGSTPEFVSLKCSKELNGVIVEHTKYEKENQIPFAEKDVLTETVISFHFGDSPSIMMGPKGKKQVPGMICTKRIIEKPVVRISPYSDSEDDRTYGNKVELGYYTHSNGCIPPLYEKNITVVKSISAVRTKGSRSVGVETDELEKFPLGQISSQKNKPVVEEVVGCGSPKINNRTEESPQLNSSILAR